MHGDKVAGSLMCRLLLALNQLYRASVVAGLGSDFIRWWLSLSIS